MKLFPKIFLTGLFTGCFIAAGCFQGGFLSAAGEDFPDQIISLELKDMDILEALKYISARTGLNIIPTKEVTGRVSLNVSNSSLKDIFDIILRSNNLAYDKKGNIFNVMSDNEYKARYGKNFYDSRISRVFRLKYAIPDQAYNLLNTMKSEIGKVLLDSESGILLVIDTPEKIAAMETTLAAMDQKCVIKAFNLKYARAKDIEEQLKSQLDIKKVGSIKADERTNQVIVQTLPERMEDISRLIRGLDQKTRQILIDAKIIQVQLTNDLTSSVEWQGLFDVGGSSNGLTYLGSTAFSAVNSTSTSWQSRSQVYKDLGNDVGSYNFTTGTSGPTTGTKELHVGVVSGSKDFDVVLKYLQTLGSTKVLSNPKLAVVNNQEAKIHVGEKQAYITSTTTQTDTSTTVAEAVTYVDLGIMLMVTPTINEDGFVTIKIKPEVSSIASFLETSSNNKIPIIDTSTAETIVMVKDGSSILIGGLSKEEKTSDYEGIPYLSKIPLIGSLFSTRSNTSKRNELLVLLTPHIINGDELVTGYSQDFGSVQDKAYHPYKDFTEDPSKLGLKTYQDYPAAGTEKQLVPELKPARNF